MRWKKTRRGLVMTAVPGATLVAGGAFALACTMPVGTTTGLPAGSTGDGTVPGTPVAAEGEVAHALEEQSNCGEDGDPTDPECTYALGVVNPADVDEAPGTGFGSSTCHYETPESHAEDSTTGDIAFATVDDNPTSHDLEAGRVLVGEGPLPSNDDGGQEMDTGPTVMCFYSNGVIGEGSALNNANDGAAAATLPEPFLVIDDEPV